MPQKQLHIEKFRRGNEIVLKHLYDKYYDALVFFGLDYITNQQIVEDIVQDCFIKLWQKRDLFYHENTIRSFLYKSVRNACFNQKEHLKVRKDYMDRELHQSNYDEDHYLNNVIKEETLRIITEKVNQLPEQARIIYLLNLKGVKLTEIAEDLDISINTVKTQKQRAKKFLKERLSELLTFFFIC